MLTAAIGHWLRLKQIDRALDPHSAHWVNWLRYALDRLLLGPQLTDKSETWGLFYRHPSSASIHPPMPHLHENIDFTVALFVVQDR
ncbi:MAG: hypothetical protein NT050_15865, partial [Verrucomicrobia bacterium]|nr:hypothetical protein [Verrucomicrobiota bacterium]